MADKKNENNEGLDNTEQNGDNTVQEAKVNPRDALIEQMQAKHWEQTEQELKAQGIDSAAPIEAEDDSELEDPVPAKAAPAVKTAAATPDILKDHVVIQDGKALLKTKIDGVEKLVPMDKAIQVLQKNESADVRLQQATQLLRENQTRATRLQAQELALANRVAPTSLPPKLDANDKANVENDANRLAEVLLSGTKDEVAGVLTDVLSNNRQALVPVVNTEEIVKQTTAIVTQKLSHADAQKVAAAAAKKFDEDFADIVADPVLYNDADRRSDIIRNENPTWGPDQVFAEAGRQTREWVQSITGVKTPSAEAIPAVPSRRQQNKQQLQPMPVSRVERAQTQEIVPVETPASVMESIRKARGQA